jgi:organic hydroperoxide reductase OsmC/OhrA
MLLVEMTEEHRYTIESKWIRDKIVTIEVAGKPTLEIATPQDFWPECPAGHFSPEELFLASAVACYGVSLHGVSQRFHADFTDFSVSGEGTLAKGESGWEFDEIRISARIVVSTEKNRKKMEKAAERAHTFCVVANSMKCPVKLAYDILVEKP